MNIFQLFFDWLLSRHVSGFRSKDVMFQLPAKTENMPHRDSILKITDTDGTFIACSQVTLHVLSMSIYDTVS